MDFDARQTLVFKTSTYQERASQDPDDLREKASIINSKWNNYCSRGGYKADSRVVERSTRRKYVKPKEPLHVVPEHEINLDNLEKKDGVLPGRPTHYSTRTILLSQASRAPLIIPHVEKRKDAGQAFITRGCIQPSDD